MATKLKKEVKRNVQMRADTLNEEERSVEFVISTEAVDTYNTVFKADGWNLQRYQNNPIVLYNHNANDVDHVIGTSEVRLEDGQLIGKVFFEDQETNPLAEKIFRKVRNGTLRGASIRAYIIDGRMGVEAEGEDPEVMYFTNQDLVEWSIVTINSNPDALARNEKAYEEMRSALIDVDEEPVNSEEEERADKFDVFDAQLIINKNSNIQNHG